MYLSIAIYSYFNAASKQSNGLFSLNDARSHWLGQSMVFDMLNKLQKQKLAMVVFFLFFFQTQQSSFQTCGNDAKGLVLEQPTIHVTTDEKS